ncbi:MAG TPA: hypothetical protein VJJ82_04480 [Candidatus Nanoarchaeia archaeon]|nr:hypothetical protein [Candidatus Nanoarchaeia archaeon]
MKPIELTFKKIEVLEYYAQLEQVKVRVLFNDGSDKGIEKQLTITDSGKHIAEWMAEIRTKVKQKHQEKTLDDHPLAGAVVLNFTQETDVIEEKMARFLAQVKERIHAGKMARLSYYDMEKKIRGTFMKLDGDSRERI